MFEILRSRIVVTQLVAILLAGLAALGIALPPAVDQASAVAAAMLVIAAATAIMRFGHAGELAADAKAWWQSKIIWTQIASATFAVLVLAGVTPRGLDEAGLVELALAIAGIATAVFRIGATSQPIG